jgi:hypothetical protein
VHFAENDNGEQGVVVIGCKGAIRSEKVEAQVPEGRGELKTHTEDRGTTMAVNRS